MIGDSNLVVYQAKGSFSLKEPSLGLYKTLAQRMEEKFYTYEIEYAQRSENQYADALAALGSQIAFDGGNASVEINKRRESIIEILQERFLERKECKKDWRAPIREALLKEEDMAKLKTLKDYIPMKGELYHRMPRRILSRCMGHKEA